MCRTETDRKLACLNETQFNVHSEFSWVFVLAVYNLQLSSYHLKFTINLLVAYTSIHLLTYIIDTIQYIYI